MDAIWSILGRSLVAILGLFGPHLIVIWSPFGRHLVAIWSAMHSPAVNEHLLGTGEYYSTHFWQATDIGELESARSRAILRLRKLTLKIAPGGPWERYAGAGVAVVFPF